jgi:N-acetylmuramoyl-L-alanine amidase
MHHRPSPNFDLRGAEVVVDMLVLHYTGMPSVGQALDRLCDADAKVSAHYLIDEDGAVTMLVEEDKRAWHAGVAYWRGHTDVNARSIGIELVNPGHEFGYRPFPEAQMTALIELARDILDRHPIPPRNVVGHSDVAPARKLDPGELFDWKRLAEAGIGLFPDVPDPAEEGRDTDRDGVLSLLGAIGYAVDGGPDAVTAFQRRYLPSRIDGMADAETAGLARAVLALCA